MAYICVRSFWASVKGVDKLNYASEGGGGGSVKKEASNAPSARSSSFRFNEISNRIDVDFHSLTLTLKDKG